MTERVFILDDQTLSNLEKRISFMKKFRRSFSKKQWIVEAISEKLERDLKELNEKMRKASSEPLGE
jgi:2-oxo-4-hydroxy-4-carboxy--5-ureidoimidazoline (OHCU) decarboxylase